MFEIQVADHRQETDRKGDDDQRLGEWQMDTGERQRDQQESHGEHGVDRGDLALRENDRMKRPGELRAARAEYASQWTAACRRTLVGQRHHGAEDQSDQDAPGQDQRRLAGELQLRGMLARKVRRRRPQVFNGDRQVGDDPRGQLRARAVDDRHQAIEQRVRIAKLGAQQRHGANDQQREQRDHHRTEHRDRELARQFAGQLAFQQRRDRADDPRTPAGPATIAGSRCRNSTSKSATADRT